MAYEMVMPYHLHMPSYFLETFTEYPYSVFYLCLPLNRCLPVRLQIFVGTAEVLVAKETVIG